MTTVTITIRKRGCYRLKFFNGLVSGK